MNDVDGSRQLAEFTGGEAQIRFGEIADHRHDAVDSQAIKLVAFGSAHDAPQRMRGAARPNQAMDLRGGGGRQVAQQVNPEEAGRPGEEYLSRSLPVRWRTSVHVDRINQF